MNTESWVDGVRIAGEMDDEPHPQVLLRQVDHNQGEGVEP